MSGLFSAVGKGPRLLAASFFSSALALAALAGCASAKTVVGGLDVALRTLREDPGATVYLVPDGRGEARRGFATLADAEAYLNSQTAQEDWVWVLQGNRAEKVSRGGAVSGPAAPGDEAPHFADLPGIRLRPSQQKALCEDILAIVHQAPHLWPGYDLAAHAILINTGEEVYAFGFREAILRQVFRASGLNHDSLPPIICGEVVLFRLAVTIEAASPFLLVFGRSGRGDPRLGDLAADLGQAFLYAELRAFDSGQRDELRRTIIHEGAHLFLQGTAVLHAEPEFCLAHQSALCGRAALEALYRDDPAFRGSVHEELCAARRIDELGRQLESRVGPEDAARLRADLATQLQTMVHARQRRGARYGTTQIEEFWYAMEGVPAYLEEAMAREAGAPHGFTRYLPESCAAEPALAYFYPLSGGGIAWYGLDLLVGGGGWRSPLAFQDGGYHELFLHLRHAIDGN